MKKELRLIAGWVVIFLGIIALPTPIPGLLIIIAGIAILEADKEKKILDKLKKYIKKWREKKRKSRILKK